VENILSLRNPQIRNAFPILIPGAASSSSHLVSSAFVCQIFSFILYKMTSLSSIASFSPRNNEPLSYLGI